MLSHEKSLCGLMDLIGLCMAAEMVADSTSSSIEE
jgi:hypothetical protein